MSADDDDWAAPVRYPFAVLWQVGHDTRWSQSHHATYDAAAAAADALADQGFDPRILDLEQIRQKSATANGVGSPAISPPPASQQKSDIAGVNWIWNKRRWTAKFSYKGKQFNLGSYREREDAEAAITDARAKLQQSEDDSQPYKKQSDYRR